MSPFDDIRHLNLALQQAAQSVQPDSSWVESMQEGIESRTAKGFFDRIADRVKRFESELDNEFEVGVRLVSFGQSLTFTVQEMGYIDPLLIIFRGHTATGDPVELIQHVNQISFVLIKNRRSEPVQPRRPIGFSAVSNPQ